MRILSYIWEMAMKAKFMKILLLLVKITISFKMIRKIIQELKKKYVLIHPYRNDLDQ